ncbi:hypothetical protein [Marinilabilia sp.]|uniref:hypothetical protein n=1 Tax=Marinilabilia sp. TaxID=2021252 RepID=UPI0025C3D15A|nr:hypothetical protein [Marinilabilia sp.]
MPAENRIIALVDLEETTSVLVSFVYKLSLELNAGVVFIHQLTGAKPSMAYQDVRAELENAQKADAWNALNRFTSSFPFKNEQYRIGRFDFPSVLSQLRNDVFLDFVVVGIKESGLLKKLFLGTTILTIIDDTEFFALGVPLIREGGISRRFSFICSRKNPFNVKNLELLMQAMKRLVCIIELIPLVLDKEHSDYLEELARTLRGYAPKVEISILKEPLSGDCKLLNESPETVIVIQQELRRLKDSVFQKTLIHDVVYDGCMPLIVVPK